MSCPQQHWAPPEVTPESGADMGTREANGLGEFEEDLTSRHKSSSYVMDSCNLYTLQTNFKCKMTETNKQKKMVFTGNEQDSWMIVMQQFNDKKYINILLYSSKKLVVN
ncbi:hypothetical protein H671_2g5149 [Cricetulus griseus]|nr:hypothetical protein H671_2g5149 [Cricetulus griseus]